MKKFFYTILLTIIGNVVFVGCKKSEVVISPSVPYRLEFNDTVFHNGDSMFGRVVVIRDSLIEGMEIKKIDCRLSNIVIGTVENELECPFGIRLKDKPSGTHTFSVIIKCEAPDCDETYWRYNMQMITIKD